MKRIHEWLAVMRIEGKRPDLRMLLLILRVWRWRSKAETLALLRQCWRCPVFNRRLHQCRPWPNAVVGCGCAMVMKVKFGGGCWARETGQPLTVGWPELL